MNNKNLYLKKFAKPIDTDEDWDLNKPIDNRPKSYASFGSLIKGILFPKNIFKLAPQSKPIDKKQSGPSFKIDKDKLFRKKPTMIERYVEGIKNKIRPEFDED